MEHVVFSAIDGGVGEEFRRVGSLEEAVRVVEHLRNDLGIADASVYALTPVPLEFKAYYRVEVPSVSALESLPPAHDEAAAPALAPALAPTPVPVSEFEDDDEREPLPTTVPSLLPDAAQIPASRDESAEESVEAERSLGYFAR